MGEHPDAVTLHGNPMTLVGDPVQVGGTAPEATLIDNERSCACWRAPSWSWTATASCATGNWSRKWVTNPITKPPWRPPKT